jgi:hypothetical protein
MVDFHSVVSSPTDMDVVSDDMVDVEATTDEEVLVTVLIWSVLQELNTKQNKTSNVKPRLIHFFIFPYSFGCFVPSNEHQQIHRYTDDSTYFFQ